MTALNAVNAVTLVIVRASLNIILQQHQAQKDELTFHSTRKQATSLANQ